MKELLRTRIRPSLEDLYRQRIGRPLLRRITEAGINRFQLYDFALLGETERNIESVRQKLKNGSVVFYMTHFGFPDQFIFPAFLMKEFGDLITRIGSPVSKKHYNFLEWWKDWRNIIHGLMMRAAPLLGFENTPVVQHYTRSLFTEEEEQKALDQFMETSLAILSQAGGVVVIPPGGRFSLDGRLQEPQRGIGVLARLLSREIRLSEKQGKGTPVPKSFVPLAITPPEGTIPVGELNAGRHFYFGKKFGLHMGAPVPLEKVINLGKNGQEIADELTERLALLLFEDRRRDDPPGQILG